MNGSGRRVEIAYTYVLKFFAGPRAGVEKRLHIFTEVTLRGVDESAALVFLQKNLARLVDILKRPDALPLCIVINLTVTPCAIQYGLEDG